MEDIKNDNFKELVLDSETMVMVDFYSPWCAPCKTLAPILDEAQKELGSKVKIYKIDAEENIDTTQKYEVMAVPTLLLFKNGEVVNTIHGIASKDEIIRMVEREES
jgi:thioredoxin 1